MLALSLLPTGVCEAVKRRAKSRREQGRRLVRHQPRRLLRESLERLLLSPASGTDFPTLSPKKTGLPFFSPENHTFPNFNGFFLLSVLQNGKDLAKM